MIPIFKEDSVMSGFEGHLFVGFALILLAITGCRFVLQELIAAVKLFKQLITELREPRVPQNPALPDPTSKKLPHLIDRRSPEHRDV